MWLWLQCGAPRRAVQSQALKKVVVPGGCAVHILSIHSCKTRGEAGGGEGADRGAGLKGGVGGGYTPPIQGYLEGFAHSAAADGEKAAGWRRGRSEKVICQRGGEAASQLHERQIHCDGDRT